MNAIFVQRIALLGAVLLLLTGTSFAQPAQGTRLGGSITSVDGDKLSIKTDDGKAVTVTLGADATVTNVVAAKLGDIKPGLFVGATAIPEAGNRWRASEVHIFPPGARPGEGHYPWNTGPNATMTNADVTAAAVHAGNGKMTLATGGKSYDFDVPSSTPIAAMKPGNRDLVKKGARVSIFRAAPSGSDSYTADAITVISTRTGPPQ